MPSATPFAPRPADPTVVALGNRRYAVGREAGMATSGLSAIFMAHRGALLRFIRARGGGADSEDVLQELWVKLSTLAAPGPISDPLGYLYRMADNLMHDRARAAGRRGRREQAWSEAQRDEIAAHHAPLAERTLLAREQLARVEQGLAALSDRSRQIFRRFRIDGLGQNEIAREEGISLSAVEKHLQRAYRALTAAAEAEHEADDAGQRGRR